MLCCETTVMIPACPDFLRVVMMRWSLPQETCVLDHHGTVCAQSNITLGEKCSLVRVLHCHCIFILE